MAVSSVDEGEELLDSDGLEQLDGGELVVGDESAQGIGCLLVSILQHFLDEAIDESLGVTLEPGGSHLQPYQLPPLNTQLLDSDPL